MARNRRSAKAAGSSFERTVADYLRDNVDDRIDRKVQTGARDTGDIGGVRIHTQRVVIECKNVTIPALASWVREAEVEAGNDGALAGVVVHKRHGNGIAAEQYVTMTLEALASILTGERKVH